MSDSPWTPDAAGAAPALATQATRLVARFDVTGWDPAEVPDALSGTPAGWLGIVAMQKTYTAGIVGSSVAQFLSSGDGDSGGYLAAERITGTLEDGRSGSFTVHHGALQDPLAASAFGYIIPGSGTGDFADFSGDALIIHDDEGPHFVFDLRPGGASGDKIE